MFLRPTEEELEEFPPRLADPVLSQPAARSDHCGTRSGNAVVISFRHKLILIAGTGYTGEIKKSVFTILNYLLPHEEGVLSMHGSANKGPKGDTALFFGLSGTGKTTLSADPNRRLIGDDEHGWTTDTIFNFEGGCYAKCINLSEEKEPGYLPRHPPGALVENTTFFPGTNRINFATAPSPRTPASPTPSFIFPTPSNPPSAAPPENIFFLTCDAYGVLPPISRLDSRPGHVPVHLRLYRERWPAPRQASPSQNPPSAPASAPPSFHCTPAATPRCSVKR
jgi:phosphoenolpyruvate carboxykinase (ATP)